jgi:D-arabinose 1-dehydrogenase-like Zn-dependent alcohol dehydrogenase
MATIRGANGDLTAAYVRNHTLYGVFRPERRRLEEMTPLFECGLVRPLIEELVGLGDLRRVHERLESGTAAGKSSSS